MDKDSMKDYSATATGGVAGLDMIYTGVDGMLLDGVDAIEVRLVLYGLFSIVWGFFAWRKRPKVQAQEPAQ